MFERNPIDSLNAVAIAVEVRLADGRDARGRSIHQLLADAEGFLYLERFDGGGEFLPTTEIRGLTVVTPVRPRQLVQPQGGDIDPARVLGVSAEASWGEIRAAYHRLAKLYHPDRYAGIELPPEVASYLEAMAKQVNLAFRLIKAARSA